MLTFCRQVFILILMSLSLFGCGSGGGSTDSSFIQPDDPVYVPIGPDKIQITVTKADALWNVGAKGAGTTIAILDTGIVKGHSEFDDANGNTRISSASTNFTYRFVDTGGHSTVLDHFLNHTANPDYAYNSEIIQNTQYDDEPETGYHGTYVASAAAGKDYGIAPEANILAIKINKVNRYDPNDPTVYEEGTTTELFLKGLDYAVTNGANVANYSYGSVWGGGYFYYDVTGTSEYDQAKTILQKGDMPLVIAAGNDGKAIGKNHFLFYNSVRLLSMDPTVGGSVLNVVSVTEQKTLSYFSNYPGDCSDIPATATPDRQCTATEMQQLQNTFIAAPGQGVPLANPELPGDYFLKDGTSFAAPIVAGAIAAIKSRWGNLTGAQIVQILKDTADRSFAGYDPKYFGVGVLDLQAALQPLGTPTSASFGRGYTPTQSAMIVPAWLNASSLGLNKVVFYDKYNRDFQFDLSRNTRDLPAPFTAEQLVQNTLWSASSSFMTFGDSAKLSLTVQPASELSSGGNVTLKKLNLTTDDYTFSMASRDGSLMTLGLADGSGLAQEMVSLSQPKLDQTVGFKASLSDGYALVTNWGTSKTRLADSHTYANYAQVGLVKHYNNLTFGMGMEIQSLDNQLAGLSGTGALGIGQNDVMLSVASLAYRTSNGGRFFSLLKYGSVESKPNPDSYFTLNSVNLGQMVLGYASPVSKGMHWGVQVFSQLKPVSGTLTYRVPDGISDTNEMTYRSGEVSISEGLMPDTLTVYMSQAW